jgi:uncharacterized membrane protein YeaQ/YmgE (transglycosylase-associated protein family)
MGGQINVPSFTIDINALITWVIIGLIAGVLATVLVRGRRYSMLASLVIGLLGAFVGGFLFSLLNLSVPQGLEGGITIRWIDIVVAFVGSVSFTAYCTAFGGVSDV